MADAVGVARIPVGGGFGKTKFRFGRFPGCENGVLDLILFGLTGGVDSDKALRTVRGGSHRGSRAGSALSRLHLLLTGLLDRSDGIYVLRLVFGVVAVHAMYAHAM